MSRNQAYRLSGEIELQALKARMGHSDDTPIPALLEREILPQIIRAMNFHPKIAFAFRSGSGAFRVGLPGKERYFKANFRGCSDLIAMSKKGIFIACEVKREGEQPTVEQKTFLDEVNANGGLGFVARSVSDMHKALESL